MRYLLLGLVAACGDNILVSPDVSPSRTITGTASFAAVDEAGNATTSPIDLHDTLVTAQFRDGDGWQIRAGTSDAAGTFQITDAPDGDYWLEVYDVITSQRQFLWTDATDLAFDIGAVGRGDARPAATNTTLTLGPITGLDPVDPADSLQIISGNLGIGATLFGALQPGATTLQTTRSWVGQPLISAVKHDHVILTQLREQTAGGLTYSSIVKSAEFDAIEQHDAADTQITGAFTTPPAFAYDLHWARSAFARASSDANPARVGAVASTNFLLRAMPGGTAYGSSPLAPIVLAFVPDVGATDLDLQFQITNPFPASWVFDDFTMAFPVTTPVPGLPGETVEVAVLVEVTTNELPDAGHPIVPLVTPALSPTIGGADLFADHTGVGLTPIIAWQPPAHGKPTAYVISILHWEGLDTGFADLAQEAALVVPGDITSVRIPARILEAGEQYALRISSISQRDQDVRTHSLYATALPFGYADLVTNTFSP